MTDFTAIATDYITVFNTTDPTQRARLIEALFTPEVTYIDPLASVTGHDGVDTLVAGAQAQFPGWTFQLTGQVDGHHHQARFTWSLGPHGQEPPVVGFDVVNLTEQGKIHAVHGFLDRVPGA